MLSHTALRSQVDALWDKLWSGGLTGAKLDPADWKLFQKQGLTGFDSDSGMTMLRSGSMNLMLPGIASPNFRYTDTHSKACNDERTYDVVLANPLCPR